MGLQSDCTSTKAYFRLRPNRKIRLFIEKHHVPPGFRLQYFNAGLFEIPEPIELPAFVLAQLGISYYCIQTGHYQVTEHMNYFVIDL